MSNAKQLHQMGVLAFESGKIEKAIQLLDHALATGESGPEVYADSGVIHRELGKLEIARDHLETAILREQNNANFHYNLALVYGDLGENAVAQDLYEKAIRINPEMAPAYNNLGNIKKDNRDYDGALSCYEASLAADPDYVPAHKNLADLFERAGDDKAAKNVYNQAINLRPDMGLRIREALVLPVVMSSGDQITEHREQLTNKLDELLDADISLEDPILEVGATNFLLAYHGRDDKDIQSKIAELYKKTCPSLIFETSHTRNWMAGLEGGVPRVGFVSSFFHAHTIAMLNRNLIGGLPKARFDVIIFSFSTVEDEWSSKFKTGNQKFVQLPKNLASARQRIAEAELDILYFTDIGMEPLTYFLGFARLAPIQCVSWGHPVTTGIPNIDYFLSSRLIEPENAQEAYSEKLIKFDRLPTCVSMPGEYAGLQEQERSAGQRIVCPQSLFKFHPDFDSMIGGILHSLPDANLQIIDGSHPAWSALLKERMLKELSDVCDRIEIIPRRNNKGIAKLLHAADVILDTPHFSGGMTTYQSLASGTPVVTLPGDFMRGRVTLGIYQEMRMMDCVSENVEGYIDITKRLCLDSTFANKVRDKICESQADIFDNRKAIDRHAKFFEKVMFEE